MLSQVVADLQHDKSKIEASLVNNSSEVSQQVTELSRDKEKLIYEKQVSRFHRDFP